MCETDGDEDDDEKGRADAHCGKEMEEMGNAGRCGGKRGSACLPVGIE